eukprot:jgi/Mesvir1/11982/Mv00295-RA.1
MNLFERFTRVIKSYANAVVTSAEDPEKILEQTVMEMGEDLVKLRQASAQVMASAKQLENKYKQAQATADDWYRRAELALQKGDEELAKEALKRRKGYLENAEGLRVQVEQQQQAVTKLIENTRILEAKMAEARSKKDTLKARAQSAKTQQKVGELMGSLSTSSALAAFERMEEKVMMMEAEAEAVAQLGTDELSSQFKLLEAGKDVDNDLEAMKQKMLGGSNSEVGQLPSSTSSKRTMSDIDEQLEALRRKASDL